MRSVPGAVATGLLFGLLVCVQYPVAAAPGTDIHRHKMSMQPTQSTSAYRRVLLKLSGEALLGEQSFGIDVNVARSVAEECEVLEEQ